MRRAEGHSATIIRPLAPTRSDQGARLKNTHQTTIASPPASPPMTAKGSAAGATTGTAYLTRNCSITMTTPGHSRSGLRGVDSVCAIVISAWTLFASHLFRRRDVAALRPACGPALEAGNQGAAGSFT